MTISGRFFYPYLKEMNERITENLVRDQLRKFGYYSEENQIVIEEQKSQIKRVQTLLKTASKAGTGKGGYPEFIINWEVDPNFLIVIECKADTRYHESPSLDKVKDYAGFLGLLLIKEYYNEMGAISPHFFDFVDEMLCKFRVHPKVTSWRPQS